MALINNNLSPLPFYDDIALQNHRKDYAFGQVYQLITYKNKLLPFQYVLTDNLALVIKVSKVYLHTLNSNKKVDITLSMLGNGLSVKEQGGFQLLKYPGKYGIPEIITEGQYYISIEFVNKKYPTLYSDVFTVCNSVDDYLLISYSNKQNFSLKNGVVDFSDNFVFKCYLNTQLGKPEYTFEEEATERMGYTFIESQVSKKIYKFVFLAPEYLCDALRIVRLCDTKIITSLKRQYDAITFSMAPEWQTQGDLASVECSFETDNIITNVMACEPKSILSDFNNDFNNDFTK